MSHKAGNHTADVDDHGNTLFHKDAANFKGTEALDRIETLGVNVNQANRAGCLPLHALCSVGWYDDYLVESVAEHTR
jgi:hypothetical protein